MELTSIRQKLKEELNKANYPVTDVTYDQFNSVVIFLDRNQLFRNVLGTVLNEKNEYGCKKCIEEKTVLLYNDSVCNYKCNVTSKEDVTLECVRSAVIQEHCVHLLKCHGYNVICPVYSSMIQRLKDFLPSLDDCFKDVEADGCNQHLELFFKSPYIFTTCDKNEEKPTQDNKIYVFDMKKYIQDKCLPSGKDCFDKNLNTCVVYEGKKSFSEEVLQSACYILQYCKEMNADICVHISKQNQAFNKQKVHLILQLMAEVEDKFMIQKHLVYGNVTQRKQDKDCGVNNAEDLFRLRYDQMRQAAIMKYSEGVHGEGWAATLESLTSACIKFEMLSCVHRNTLKLDISEDEDRSQSDGSFVMYNYARLSTLFKHFNEAVYDGTYPPLPPVDEIDFKTLREEAEWCLLYNYIYTYPTLIEQCVESIEKTDSIHLNIHTHKVCQMLCSLSRTLSSYYSRYHVLGEARSHLLPTMYARLYLLRAVQQIMENAFKLLGIQPLSQL
ncbi:DALR anticodon-binding domain-containing protein 3 [Mactra antiquata]